MNSAPNIPAGCVEALEGNGSGRIPAASTRPSSTRRLRQFESLIEALSGRTIDVADVASLLHCSSSSARNYLADLLDASVIRFQRDVEAAGRPAKSGYRLNEDPWIARNFLLRLSESQSNSSILKSAGKRTSELGTNGTRHFHILADDHCTGARVSRVAVRRDPLVAALFGDLPSE